jgi:uncharacterized HAD superfamily protein
MKISFDFDGTLSLPWVQELCKSLLKEHIIICTTSRDINSNNDDLFEITDHLGLEVFFTNHNLKIESLKENNVDIHFDDDIIEVDEINKYSDIKGILLNYRYYQ